MGTWRRGEIERETKETGNMESDKMRTKENNGERNRGRDRENVCL
jgi:hypothetical protein